MKLDFERIQHRSKKKINELLFNHSCSIKEESSKEQKAFKLKRATQTRGMQVSLLHLYNVEGIEFVRETFFDDYRPVDWPHQATHQLIATSWVQRDESTPTQLHASSVCAVPLKPKLRSTRLIVRKLPSKEADVYLVNSNLEGKRAVLRALCKASKAKLSLKLIEKMSSKECDQVYANLHRAYKLLKRKQGKL